MFGNIKTKPHKAIKKSTIQPQQQPNKQKNKKISNTCTKIHNFFPNLWELLFVNKLITLGYMWNTWCCHVEISHYHTLIRRRMCQYMTVVFVACYGFCRYCCGCVSSRIIIIHVKILALKCLNSNWLFQFQSFYWDLGMIWSIQILRVDWIE